MMYLRWLLISIYAIVTTLLAMVLTPFVVLFANRKTGRLPWPFHWMETPDVPLPGDPNVVGVPTTVIGWYWASMRWLWRNPAYRATDRFKFIPIPWQGKLPPDYPCGSHSGNPAITEAPFVGGYFYATMRNDKCRVFNYYWLWKWPGINKCIRLQIGWKLKPWFAGKPYVPTDVDGMHVISFNPFMGCVP